MIVKSRRETLGLLAAGAAAVPGLAGLAKAQAALRPMRLRLDFLATTPHVYFFAAREKGFFAEEGLNIEILEGNTSAQSIQQVANKGDDFGVAGFDALVHSTQEGLPATMIMCNFRNTPNVVLSLESSGISSPADLEGKTIGVRAGSGPTTMFPALMAKAGVNAEKVSQLNLDFSAFIPSLLAKRISGFVGFAPTQYPVLVNLAKEPVKVLYYTESGLVALSMGIVTHPDTIRDKPDQVRGFVRAAQRGMKWSRENPADAEKMLAAARASGRIAVLGYNYIQNPVIRHIGKLLADGEIGPSRRAPDDHQPDHQPDRPEPDDQPGRHWPDHRQRGHDVDGRD